MQANQDQDTKSSQVVVVRPSDAESPSENYLVSEHLQRAPNLIARGLVYVIVLLLVTALTYSLLSKIDVVVEGTAVARPMSHQIRILSDMNGFIDKIFINVGEVIDKKTPLFLIRSKEGLTYRAKIDQLRQAIPLKEEYYDTKIAAALEKLQQLNTNFSSSLRVKKLKHHQNDLKLKSIESDRLYWNGEIDLASKDTVRVEKLHQKGIVADRERDLVKSKLVRARTEVKKLISETMILEEENKIIERELETEKANYKNEKTLLENEIKNITLDKMTTLNEMQNELQMNEKMHSLQGGLPKEQHKEAEEGKIIWAEKPSIISELHFKNTGEYIRESDLLCTIIPAESPLYIDATIANKDIGFIEKDMEIKYKFDAFP